MISSDKKSKSRIADQPDRIDIHIEVPRVDYEKLSNNRIGESSVSIRQRAQAALISTRSMV